MLTSLIAPSVYQDVDGTGAAIYSEAETWQASCPWRASWEGRTWAQHKCLASISAGTAKRDICLNLLCTPIPVQMSGGTLQNVTRVPSIRAFVTKSAKLEVSGTSNGPNSSLRCVAAVCRGTGACCKPRK